VTDRDELAESMFMSGYDPDGAFLTHFYQDARGVRRLGSAALHLCYLASGSADAVWEYDTYPWDVAAGMVIAEAAGATITDTRGNRFELPGEEQRSPMIGTNGHIHDEVIQKLNDNTRLSE
jgi:myo-inositol-1(or 4)-monophosphatase